MRFFQAILALLTLLPAGHTAAQSASSLDGVFAQSRKSVVRIHSFAPGMSLSHGTGFVVDSQGHIATNHHVVDGAEAILVLYNTGQRVESRVATIVKADQDRDLAIIKVRSLSALPVTLNTSVPAALRPVMAVGFPGMLDDDVQKLSLIFNYFHYPIPTKRVRMLLSDADEVLNTPGVASLDDAVRVVLKLVAEELGEDVGREVTGEYQSFQEGETAFFAGFNESMNKDLPLDTTTKSITDQSPTMGQIIKVSERAWEGREVKISIIEHGAKISPGNSGGPLINGCGEVIGINSQRRSDGQGVDSGSSSAASVLQEWSADIPGLRILSTARPCLGDFSSSRGLKTIHLVLLGVILVLVLIALYLGVKKPQFVSETYTQYIRRGGGSHLDPRSDPRPAPKVISVADPARPGIQTPASPQIRYSLDGASPEGTRFRLSFTRDDLTKANNRLMIGRKRDLVHLEIDHDTVSRQHAVITCPPGKSSLYLESRSKGNVTMVDGRELSEDIVALKLKNGSKVQLGEVTLNFAETHG